MSKLPQEHFVEMVAERVAYYLPRTTDLYDGRSFEEHRQLQLTALAQDILDLVDNRGYENHSFYLGITPEDEEGDNFDPIVSGRLGALLPETLARLKSKYVGEVEFLREGIHRGEIDLLKD